MLETTYCYTRSQVAAHVREWRRRGWLIGYARRARYWRASACPMDAPEEHKARVMHLRALAQRQRDINASLSPHNWSGLLDQTRKETHGG